jgi:fatty acid desaturase
LQRSPTYSTDRFTPPTTLNHRIALALVVYHVVVLLALPLWLLPQSLWWGVLVIAPFFWLHSAHWALIHEAIHKNMHEDSVQNEAWGRLLSVLLGASFHVLRFGHLTHHQLNRDWHSEYVEKRTFFNQIAYYTNLTVGLYLSEVIGSFLLALLPKRAFLALGRISFLRDYPEVARTGDRFFYQRENIRPLREDVATITLLYVAAFWVYGAFWKVLLAFLIVRAVVISVMDNIYHYATPADNSQASKELWLHPALARLILFSNHHETHHLNPRLPWTSLEADNRMARRGYDGSLLAHCLVQFGGAMCYDATAQPIQRWMPQEAKSPLQWQAKSCQA